MLINAKDIIDLVQIENKYAIFSTYKNDVVFHRDNNNTPIFCGGIIKTINQNVYNFKINEKIGYISCKQEHDVTLSSNQIIKIASSNNEKLIAVLLYASYAMKILRHVNPRLNQNIAIIKINFFSILLERLIKFSGANVFLIDSKDYSKLNGIAIDTIIYYSLAPEVNEFISNINCEHKIDLNNISLYDIGLNDYNYLKGVKYPYSYIRWDFKKNLEYFIHLIDNQKVLLDFFEVHIDEISQLDEITRKASEYKEDSLILFKISKK
jgi:hypothetical protein